MSGERYSKVEKDLIERAAQVLPAGGFGNFAADNVLARGKGGRVKLDDLVIFSRQIAVMIRAGLPLLNGEKKEIDNAKYQHPRHQRISCLLIPNEVVVGLSEIEGEIAALFH